MGKSYTIKSPKTGAGELSGQGPGKMAMRVKTKMSGTNFTGGKNSYSPKIRIANRGKK